MTRKYFSMLYALLCYALGLAVTAWYAIFLPKLWTPPAAASSEMPLALALLINVGLIALFGLQHSVMARKPFKKVFNRAVSPAVERSTYILMTVVCLGLLMWCWQPVSIALFDLRGTVAGGIILGIYCLGWVIGLSSTFLINHWDLFGLRQAWMNLTSREAHSYKFQTPLFYKFVRHPIYTGWLLIHWATPHLTLDHLLLAGGMTVYIFIGMYYEEKDLVRSFGDRYRTYKERVPGLVPFSKKSKKQAKHEAYAEI